MYTAKCVSVHSGKVDRQAAATNFGSTADFLGRVFELRLDEASIGLVSSAGHVITNCHALMAEMQQLFHLRIDRLKPF